MIKSVYILYENDDKFSNFDEYLTCFEIKFTMLAVFFHAE